MLQCQSALQLNSGMHDAIVIAILLETAIFASNGSGQSAAGSHVADFVILRRVYGVDEAAFVA